MTKETLFVAISSDEPTREDAAQYDEWDRNDIASVVEEALEWYGEDISPDWLAPPHNFIVWDDAGNFVARGTVAAKIQYVVDVTGRAESYGCENLEWENEDRDEVAAYMTPPHASCCRWDEWRIYGQTAQDLSGATWFRWIDEQDDETGVPTKDRDAMISGAQKRAKERDQS